MVHAGDARVWLFGSRRRLAALITTCVLAVSGATCNNGSTSATQTPTTTTTPSVGPAAGTPPNIVLILTDDQPWDTLKYMPFVSKALVDKGVRFTNGFVVNSMCCPSRSSILTGDYSHTTGVYTNSWRYQGGWPVFHRRGWEQKDLPVWLHAAGYRTALVGKYFNQYGPRNRFVPPGWDRWAAMDQVNGRYFDYSLNLDGKLVHYGNAPADYSTDVLGRLSAKFITSTPANIPLFLYFAPFAPHGPWTPAPRDVGSIPTIHRRLPDFNEADVSDKPNYIRVRPPVSPSLVDSQFTLAVESLGAVDDAVRRIMTALQAAGRQSNTLFVFMTDNGVAFGEHRWTNKAVPYEESIRVPFVVRYDPLTKARQGTSNPQLVLNIDLAQTFAQVAGVAPIPKTDGRSLVPLLDGTATRWRTEFLIEHLAYPPTALDPNPVPTFCAIRSRHWMYARYSDGFEELYSLRTDPFELRNIAGTDPRRLRQMRSSARRLCSPLPPGMPPF